MPAPINRWSKLFFYLCPYSTTVFIKNLDDAEVEGITIGCIYFLRLCSSAKSRLCGTRFPLTVDCFSYGRQGTKLCPCDSVLLVRAAEIVQLERMRNGAA